MMTFEMSEDKGMGEKNDTDLECFSDLCHRRPEIPVDKSGKLRAKGDQPKKKFLLPLRLESDEFSAYFEAASLDCLSLISADSSARRTHSSMSFRNRL